MSDGERYTRMINEAKYSIPVGKYTADRTQILALALEVARENECETDKRLLKLKIRQRIRERMRSQYGFIGWQIVLWWLLPKLIDWFIAWWFRDKERAKSQ